MPTWTRKSELAEPVRQFLEREDCAEDVGVFWEYDLNVVRAHVCMLSEKGILTPGETAQAEALLDRMKEEGFSSCQDAEDVHSIIEERMTAELPTIGPKLHTGKSRNDEALTMVRLFCLDRLQKTLQQVARLAEGFSEKAASWRECPMPGYTHLRPAMPTTVGVWLDAYGQAFRDTEPLLAAARQLLDQSPLGSASGFGISNFDPLRPLTARKLGFSCVQKNPIYCGLSRGFFELTAARALQACVCLVTRFSHDLMMFTQPAYAFFRLPDSMLTGSSIMPQKKNYDVVELLRAQGARVSAEVCGLEHIVSQLGSGYHRDLQVTKGQIRRIFDLVSEALDIATLVVNNLQLNEARLREQMTTELMVTNRVYEEVAKGKAFRDAYHEVKQEILHSDAEHERQARGSSPSANSPEAS